jgi:hypothetical protein
MDQPAQMMQSDCIGVTAQLAFNRGDLFVLICHLFMPLPKGPFSGIRCRFCRGLTIFHSGF